MKALVKKYAKEGLWLEDMPMPIVGNNDVLIKLANEGFKQPWGMKQGNKSPNYTTQWTDIPNIL